MEAGLSDFGSLCSSVKLLRARNYVGGERGFEVAIASRVQIGHGLYFRLIDRLFSVVTVVNLDIVNALSPTTGKVHGRDCFSQ